MTITPNTTNDRWPIARLLSWTTDYFEKQSVDDPRLAAEVLLAHAVECKRIDLYARFEVEPAADQTTKFRALVKRAASHEPIAYLVGEKEFFSLTFYVTSDVLIPRGETETLVEQVVDYCRAHKVEAETAGDARPTETDQSAETDERTGLTNPSILDIGTGSGCIPIAILSQLKKATAVATDISPGALDIARKNAERHEVSDRITFIEADRLAIPADAVPEGGFDIILSNPPYVSESEMETLASNVRDYEPHAALTDHSDGLSFYKTIAADAPGILRPGGIVFVEIGDGQEQPVRDTMTQGNQWQHRGTWRDSVTGNPRVMAFALNRGD
jgi:release factor glutamine methyltransferase